MAISLVNVGGCSTYKNIPILQIPPPIPIPNLGGQAANFRQATPGTRRTFWCRACGGKEEFEESREILSAFFLGKAFAEAVSERVTSAVGEIVGELGRKQAQQQKDIRHFQEEVEARAKDSMALSTSRPERDQQEQK